MKDCEATRTQATPRYSKRMVAGTVTQGNLTAAMAQLMV